MVEDKVVDQDKATLDAVVKVLNDQLESLGMKVAKGELIAVFDAETIIDRSTYREPLQASEGVRYLLVGGAFVVQEGEFQEQARPGRLVTGTMR